MQDRNPAIIKVSQEIKGMFKYASNYKPEEMRMVFAKLSALKSALESADMFYHASVQYARLEAYALIRAVELSDGNKPELTGKNKTARASAAVWLYNMTEEEREHVIDRCEEGKTIVALYKETTSPSKEERAEEIKNEIISDVKECIKDGICDSNFYGAFIKKVDPELRNGIKDEVKRTLRQSGAIELGTQSGIYIIPESESGEVHDALKRKLCSIQSDFANFLYVARQCKQKPFFKLTDTGNSNVGVIDFLLILAAKNGEIVLSSYPATKQRALTLLQEISEFVQQL